MKTHLANMILGLGLAGLLSGILTLLCMPLLGGAAGLFTPGAIFGLTIALFLCLFARERSVVKALALCVASSASYIGAYFATVFADMAIPHGEPTQSVNPPAFIMIVGGVIGGFCVCAVALFLYSPERRRLLSRALWCSLAGGLLGLAGYAFGSLFEGAMSIQRSGEMPGMATLFLVWPAGMGAVLGSVLQLEPVTHDKGYWPGSYRIGTEPVASHPTRASQPRHVSFVGWTFVGLLCAVFVSFIGRILWTSHNFDRQTRLYAEYRSTQPSLDNLPPLEALDAKDVFIDQPIAGTTPSPSPMGYRLSKSQPNQPEFAHFSMCYMRLTSERCGANPPAIDVEIIQYPAPAWAEYAMRGKAYGSGPGYYQQPENLVRIGHHIHALENPHERGHGDFYWTDGSVLVTVRSDISDPTPFVDAYLEKFPTAN
ncbi:MAG: hypothetical protein WB919_00190 [Candidatus Sulfotelmatobacter sp.]